MEGVMTSVMGDGNRESQLAVVLREQMLSFKVTRAFLFWRAYWDSTNVKHPTFRQEPLGLPW